jgi:hypothetical protein
MTNIFNYLRGLSLLIGIATFLTGCSTGEVLKTPNNETYTVHSEYMFLAGGWERSSFEAREKASNFCKSTGLQMEIFDEKRDGTPGFTPLATDLHFKCVGKGQLSSSSVQNTLTFDQAKNKCIELGFKLGTESFGQCILKLAK